LIGVSGASRRDIALHVIADLREVVFEGYGEPDVHTGERVGEIRSKRHVIISSQSHVGTGGIEDLIRDGMGAGE
jgi:hypothetical protein